MEPVLYIYIYISAPDGGMADVIGMAMAKKRTDRPTMGERDGQTERTKWRGCWQAWWLLYEGRIFEWDDRSLCEPRRWRDKERNWQRRGSLPVSTVILSVTVTPPGTLFTCGRALSLITFPNPDSPESVRSLSLQPPELLIGYCKHQPPFCDHLVSKEKSFFCHTHPDVRPGQRSA